MFRLGLSIQTLHYGAFLVAGLLQLQAIVDGGQCYVRFGEGWGIFYQRFECSAGGLHMVHAQINRSQLVTHSVVFRTHQQGTAKACLCFVQLVVILQQNGQLQVRLEIVWIGC